MVRHTLIRTNTFLSRCLSEDAALPMQGIFTRQEGTRTLTFAWLAFERLEREYFYPIFLKTKIFDLPEQLELLAEYE